MCLLGGGHSQHQVGARLKMKKVTCAEGRLQKEGGMCPREGGCNEGRGTQHQSSRQEFELGSSFGRKMR